MKTLVKTFESFNHNSKLGSIEIDHNSEIDHESHHEVNHYMFFGNLETIKRYVDAMLEMDPVTVNELLDNGHDWAADHIATSKDDIEEVANFLMNKMHESPESEDEMFEDEENDEYVGEKYSCNECGMTYEGGIYEDDEDESVCEGCGGIVTRM
jgi:rubrerythrin